MLNLLTRKKLKFTANQMTGLLMINFLYSDAVKENSQADMKLYNNPLSINETLNLLNKMDIKHLSYLMLQTSPKIFEYVCRNSRTPDEHQCILFVERKHPFLSKKFTLDEKKVDSPLFLQVLGDYLNEVKYNPTVKKEFKEIILDGLAIRQKAA